MKAYEEQKKTLEHLKIKFCNNCYTHLKNVIGHVVISLNLIFRFLSFILELY
jgi:hypothetical protein